MGSTVCAPLPQNVRTKAPAVKKQSDIFVLILKKMVTFEQVTMT